MHAVCKISTVETHVAESTESEAVANNQTSEIPTKAALAPQATQEAPVAVAQTDQAPELPAEGDAVAQKPSGVESDAAGDAEIAPEAVAKPVVPAGSTGEPSTPVTAPANEPTAAATGSPAPADATPAMAPARAWEPSKKATPRQRRRRIRRIIAAALVALYALGAWHFSSHFVPGTTVDGIDASYLSSEELASALTERAASYQLAISDPNGFATTLNGTDFAFSTQASAVAAKALERTTPVLWLPYLLTPQHMLIDAQIGFDEEALRTQIATAVDAYNKEAEQPTNAKASYNKDEGHFVISDESCGTALDAAKIYDACVPACRELAPSLALDGTVLLQPTIAHDNADLVAVVDRVNKILDTPLEIKCGDETVCTVDRDTVASWISITDTNELKVEGVYDWIGGNDAIKDAGNTSDDEHVWELDAQGTCDAIHDVIENNTGKPAEVARTLIETKPPVTPGAKERGRHIDVNLTTQFARFYDTDGKVIWDSPFVSGNVAEGRDTPTGEFAIEGKEAGRTLVGADEDQDGKPDYESYVNFWMPFLRGDWGLHDATWRWDSEFGGDTYTYNGSHGCINLPYDKAEALFNLCVVGDPVIVHY